MIINGGLRATLAAINQENAEDRARRKAAARWRREVRRHNREVEKEKNREEEGRRRRFGERVKFCDCGFRRFFGR
jgi:hypothetical protein